MEKMPKTIVASRQVTYDIPTFIANWTIHNNGTPPDWETVIEFVQEWAHEDLYSGGYSDPTFKFLDEDGNDVSPGA